MTAGQGVLVVGYGNPLRGDDGAGWRAAELLEADPRAAGAQVVVCHQLTPELAEDVSQADLVVLVDASSECSRATASRAGAVAVRSIQATHAGGSGQTALSSLFSHHIDAERLLQISGDLYGRCPPAVMVTIQVADVAGGTTFSEPVEASLPALVDAVIDVMRVHAGQSA
jgi:hydrogenase maturation protease